LRSHREQERRPNFHPEKNRPAPLLRGRLTGVAYPTGRAHFGGRRENAASHAGSTAQATLPTRGTCRLNA